MHYRFWRQDGRTFLIAYGKATYIEELHTDGTLRPLACLSSAHQFSYSRDWRPAAGVRRRVQPRLPRPEATDPGVSGRPNHGFGMLWVDRNGDGQMQADEIEFSTAAESLAGSGWGHDFADLTLRVTGTVGGKAALVTLTAGRVLAGRGAALPRPERRGEGGGAHRLAHRATRRPRAPSTASATCW